MRRTAVPPSGGTVGGEEVLVLSKALIRDFNHAGFAPHAVRSGAHVRLGERPGVRAPACSNIPRIQRQFDSILISKT